jgi:SAM-dependent methyltransferase
MLDHQRLYEYRFRDVDQVGREAVWSEIAAWIHRRLGEPERILDAPAGSCEFVNAVPAAERWALDRMRYGDPAEGVRFVAGDVFEAELPAEHFDAVFVSNFLEHLPDPDAVAAFLARVRGWLRPGGRVAILGPNYARCADVYWDCADHTLALTHVAVEEHLYAAGFDPEETLPAFLPYSFRGRLPASPGLTRLYLRTPAAWRLLGKQFFVVGRR